MLTTCGKLHSNELENIWIKCLEILKNFLGEDSVDTWFKPAKLEFDEKNNPVIIVPNAFFADFIEENYKKILISALNKLNIKNIQNIAFKPQENEIEQTKKVANVIINKNYLKKQNNQFNLNSNYTFENFIVGDSNRFSFTTALAVAEAPGKTSFNPLTIYGNTGLGKTHLLQAIGHFAIKEDTADNVLYITAQDFINQYMDHIKNNKDSISFVKKFYNIDLLLIDDIHFFSKKPTTQKEFFHIFSNLLNSHKQIVMTSDKKPDMIPDMMKHMINRFMSGLVVDIQPPNFETRMAILKKKAELDGYILDDNVIQYIAAKITSNVRELEGTLIKLIASTTFTGKDITIETAKEIFQDKITKNEFSLNTENIQKEVAEYFNISVNQLRAHTRKRNISYPRNIAMYITKKWTKQALRTIGLDFGGRDYSTVIHACKKIENMAKYNKNVKNDIENIEKAIKKYM